MSNASTSATGSRTPRPGGCPVAESAIVSLFTDRGSRANLYERLETARSNCPVHRSDALGQWFLTAHDDVKDVLRDSSKAVDYARQMDMRRPDWREHPAFALNEQSVMLNLDGADHTRLRKVGLAAINHRLVKRVTPQIRATVERIVAEFASRGGGDFVTEVAFPITAEVISDIMGLPHEDRDWYRIAIAEHVVAFDPSVTPENLAKADAAAQKIRRYWQDLVALRLADPKDDIISELVQQTSQEGDGLRPEEVAVFCEFLFSAGFETTVHTLSLGTLAFIENPDQWAMLRSGGADLSRTMVEEVLRYTTTIVAQSRFTTAPSEVGGVEVPDGELLFVSLAGANRDPAVFRDPDRFDIARDDGGHVTFGHGRHLCLGAPLARAEIQVVFETMAAQLAEIALGPGGAVYEPRLAPRALATLDLEVRSTRSTRT